MNLISTDYENIADTVIDRYVSQSTPLNDSILKIAEEKDLNPDQIKRVVEMANTKAFLHTFKTPERKEGSGDVDFDVADAGKILGKYYGSSCEPKAMKKVTITTVTTSTPEDEFFGDIPDMMGMLRKGGPLAPSIEPPADLGPRPDRRVVVMRLKKVAENLGEKLYDTEYDYQDCLSKLAQEFKKDYGPDFEEFEKKAYCLNGNDVEPLLKDLREKINYNKIYVQDDFQEKVAHIVEEDVYTAAFSEMYKIKLDQMKFAQGIKVAQAKIGVLTNAS